MLWHDASWGLPKWRCVNHTGKQSVGFSYFSNKTNENYKSTVLNIKSARMALPELKIQSTVALIIFFKESCKGLLWKVWDQKQWDMEIIVLKRRSLILNNALPALRYLRSYLHFSSVASPRAPLIIFVLEVLVLVLDLFHLQKVREKRNSNIRGHQNLCEGRPKNDDQWDLH